MVREIFSGDRADTDPAEVGDLEAFEGQGGALFARVERDPLTRRGLQLVEDFVGVFTELWCAIADFEGGLRRACEGAGRASASSRGQLEIDEIVAVFELFEAEHVVEGQHRSDRRSDLESGNEELALGLGGQESSDRLGEFVQ